MLDTILFDLDGTLLPLDDKQFIELYMGLMGRRFQRLGHDPKAFVNAVWAGTKAMIKNDGTRTNEAVFRSVFAELIDDLDGEVYREFERFYLEDFPKVQASARPSKDSRKIVALLKEKGYRLAVATNPLFPMAATRQRIAWAGLEESDFELVTTYENSRFAKPNPKYFKAVLETLGISHKTALMVGNDRFEDGAAEQAGIPVYIVTDCLINDKGLDMDDVAHGTLKDFAKFVSTLPNITKRETR